MIPLSFRNIYAAAQASLTICTILFSDPSISHADVLHVNDSIDTHTLVDVTGVSHSAPLKSCEPQSNCVSSNYKEPPNRYVSPLKIVNDRDVAFQRAVRDLKEANHDVSIVEIAPKDYFIHVTVPGTAPNSLDDIELKFLEGIINVRCESRVTLPPPPFCIQKNCINGNMDQRTRISRIAYALGLPPSDREQMQGAVWTPIFLNSDRVPAYDE